MREPEFWKSRGPKAAALWPLSALFGAVVAVRRWLYRAGWLTSHTIDVPVVVVGNLVAGGAGKTPTVMAVVDILRRRGRVPGVVSRGHGRSGDAVLDVTRGSTPDECGDEPLLLRLRLDAPVVVGRDRVAAARALRRLHPQVDVIVCDDGLQHWRLTRDLNVIVFDERGAGNGWLLPAGPLREPLQGTPPPRSIVLYNAPRSTTPWPGHLGVRTLGGPVVLTDWWRGLRRDRADWLPLQDRPLLAVAGTARPGRFFDMLRAEGLTIEPLPMPDHFDFARLPWPPGTRDVVVTEKDAVKLSPDRVGNTRVVVAPLDFQADDAFEAALLHALNLPGTTP